MERHTEMAHGGLMSWVEEFELQPFTLKSVERCYSLGNRVISVTGNRKHRLGA